MFEAAALEQKSFLSYTKPSRSCSTMLKHFSLDRKYNVVNSLTLDFLWVAATQTGAQSVRACTKKTPSNTTLNKVAAIWRLRVFASMSSLFFWSLVAVLGSKQPFHGYLYKLSFCWAGKELTIQNGGLHTAVYSMSFRHTRVIWRTLSKQGKSKRKANSTISHYLFTLSVSKLREMNYSLIWSGRTRLGTGLGRVYCR